MKWFFGIYEPSFVEVQSLLIPHHCLQINGWNVAFFPIFFIDVRNKIPLVSKHLVYRHWIHSFTADSFKYLFSHVPANPIAHKYKHCLQTTWRNKYVLNLIAVSFCKSIQQFVVKSGNCFTKSISILLELGFSQRQI